MSHPFNTQTNWIWARRKKLSGSVWGMIRSIRLGLNKLISLQGRGGISDYGQTGPKLSAVTVCENIAVTIDDWQNPEHIRVLRCSTVSSMKAFLLQCHGKHSQRKWNIWKNKLFWGHTVGGCKEERHVSPAVSQQVKSEQEQFPPLAMNHPHDKDNWQPAARWRSVCVSQMNVKISRRDIMWICKEQISCISSERVPPSTRVILTASVLQPDRNTQECFLVSFVSRMNSSAELCQRCSYDLNSDQQKLLWATTTTTRRHLWTQQLLTVFLKVKDTKLANVRHWKSLSFLQDPLSIVHTDILDPGHHGPHAEKVKQ